MLHARAAPPPSGQARAARNRGASGKVASVMTSQLHLSARAPWRPRAVPTDSSSQLVASGWGGGPGSASPYASLSSWDLDDDVDVSAGFSVGGDEDGGGGAATNAALAPPPRSNNNNNSSSAMMTTTTPSSSRAAGGPSEELRRMAQEQLRALAGVAERVSRLEAASSGGDNANANNAGPSSSFSPLHLRASVYVRHAGSIEQRAGSSFSSNNNELVLERVATWPPQSSGAAGAGGLSGDTTDGDGNNNSVTGAEMLVLRGADWGADGSGSDGGGGASEASLVQEEVIELPSNTLVLPLSERGFLVGLLVAERPGGRGGGGASSSSSSSSSSSAASATVLWALRAFAPVLASACALDLSGALAAAQAAARQRAARGLLAEARRPLRALRTLGGMLYGSSSRTNEATATTDDGLPTAADFEADMAAGVVAQSQRLADVIAALDVALHPSSPPSAVASAAAMVALPFGGGGGGGGGGLSNGGSAGLLPEAASGVAEPSTPAVAAPAMAALRPGAIAPAVVEMGGAAEGVQQQQAQPTTINDFGDADCGGGGGTIDVSLAPTTVEEAAAAAAAAAAATTSPSPSPSSSSSSSPPRCDDVAAALSGTLTWLAGAARAAGVAVIATGPLRAAAAAAAAPPTTPLRAGVSAAAVARCVGGVLTVALRSTPPGGQIQVGARAVGGGSGGVEVSVVHTGDADAERLYSLSSSSSSSSSPPPLPSSSAQAAASSSSSSPQGLVSLEGVDRALRRAGGRVVVTPRFDFVSARTGKLVGGTRIEVLLPGAVDR